MYQIVLVTVEALSVVPEKTSVRGTQHAGRGGISVPNDDGPMPSIWSFWATKYSSYDGSRYLKPS